MYFLNKRTIFKYNLQRLFMFDSILDKIFVACSNRNGEIPSKAKSYQIKERERAKYNWVCFVPEFCDRIYLIKNKIIKEGKNVNFYILPKTTIQSNPKLTQKFLDNILKEAITNQKRNPSKKINVLGVSLGNVLAFRFAEYFKINKLISVVPGSRLAECAWESIATKEIVRNSGLNLKDYKKILKNYNPIESVPKISTKYAEIFLGTSDLMIPYQRGKELAEAMQKNFKNINVYSRKFSGHVETIFYFVKQFKG
jgi:hypothetical protein